MLLVNNINIKYDGNDILNNISFEFTPGKVVLLQIIKKEKVSMDICVKLR